MVDPDHVVIVDEQGRTLIDSEGAIYIVEKYEAHRLGLLHRAVSVFLFHGDTLLLQRRALHKYHSPGLWTNTCCTHPRVDETPMETAIRRLWEEMGIRYEHDLKELFQFTYFVRFASDLYEYEYDHVFAGLWHGTPFPDPNEVMDWRWINYIELEQDLVDNPEIYTYWLRVCLGQVIHHLFSR